MQRKHNFKRNFVNKKIVIDNLVSHGLKIFGNKKLRPMGQALGSD